MALHLLRLFFGAIVTASVVKNGTGMLLDYDSSWDISPRCEPWCWNIYLHNWVIFGVNVAKSSILFLRLGKMGDSRMEALTAGYALTAGELKEET